MTQLQISKAYLTLVEIYKIKFPTLISKEIYKLKNLFKDTYDFNSNEEKKILQSYDGTVNENGSIFFKGTDGNERMQKFDNELKRMYESEVEIAFTPITITKADSNDKNISGADIENLEGFIIFE